MILRAATEADHPAFRALFPLLGVPDGPPPLEGAALLMAEENGEALGFLLHERHGTFVNVVHLVVAPSRQRMGVGEALMRSLGRLAKRDGCTHWALTVRADNAPARRLYEKLELVETGRGLCLELGRADWMGSGVCVPVSREDCAELERRFDVMPGRLAAWWEEDPLSLLVTPSRVALGRIKNPDGPLTLMGAPPAGEVRALLAHAFRVSRPQAQAITLLLEQSPLAETLRAGGAKLAFEILRMQGSLEEVGTGPA